MMLTVDRPPKDDDTEQHKRQALFIYRKITVLTCVPCCGMCGTTRHSTKPFWCLGMRVCRSCVQANLVSSIVLYERFWVTFGQPVQSWATFVHAVCMNVLYFSTRLTPNQRLDFSCDRLDFPGGTRTVWFFWKPHLAKVLDMDKLEREGKEKHAAASLVRGMARRALVLRAMHGSKVRRCATFLPSGCVFGKRDLVCTEFRLRKTELLDRIDTFHEQRMRCHLKPDLFARLSAAEDRVVPFMFN